MTKQVEHAARTTMGSGAHVQKAGSQMKHVDITKRSDLDLMVSAQRPMTSDDKRNLVGALRQEFGCAAVEEHKYHIQASTTAGTVDVVPRHAEFLRGPNFRNVEPRDRFHANTKGQAAVRGVKMFADDYGYQWKGRSSAKDHLEKGTCVSKPQKYILWLNR